MAEFLETISKIKKIQLKQNKKMTTQLVQTTVSQSVSQSVTNKNKKPTFIIPHVKHWSIKNKL